MAVGGRECVMVVMPRLAPGRDRQPGHIARLIPGVEVAASEEVADRVDREGRVVDEEDARGTAPQQALETARDRAGQRDPETEGEGEAEHHPARQRPRESGGGT